MMHDLRHTWASWHVQRGTSSEVLKELGGWETMEMVRRYVHLPAGHLSRWVQPVTEVPPKLHLAALQAQFRSGMSETGGFVATLVPAGDRKKRLKARQIRH